jgi:glutamate-1-semialdehyde 2,1-aminomutase
LDRDRLASLIEVERRRYAEERTRSRAALEAARASLLAGVPMTWMSKWPGGFPPQLASARGCRVSDIDGHEYVDFCLGDTGAMAGHSPEPTVRAVAARLGDAGGVTAMLPTEDGAVVGDELRRRFGVERWSFTLTATDANRWAIRLARQITGRPRILVFNYCYHGSVDEAFATVEDGRVVAREGNVGPPVDLAETTRVVEFNDAEALERELAHGDVAAVLAEPALTNVGIVLPEPGFHDVLRELTRAAGSLLIIDETHTFSAGPGGCTRAWGLGPDVVTIGKAIGGGVPVGAYGLSADLADRIVGDRRADLEDVGGVGGTLAGNALSLAAVRATLSEVLTDEAFPRMDALAERFERGVADAIEAGGAPWCVVRLGARVEYRFCPEPPRDGGSSAAAEDPGLDEYMHLQAANRGILLTPFHNMALMCPETTEADVDLHTSAFSDAVTALFG